MADDPVQTDPEQQKIDIVQGRPPNFEAIAAVLPGAYGDGVIFTYGHTIYIHNGVALSKSLLAHEVVHVRQQEIMGRDEWWDRYLTDRKFRFGQELEAHRMEYAAFEGNRKTRMRAEHEIAARLAGPLYGNQCSPGKALRLMRA